MGTVKENMIQAKKDSTVTENTGCCLKCKGRENNTCSKISFHEKTQESENNKLTDIKSWQPDVLAEYVYREHHQYYYKEEAVLAELLANCMSHLETKDYELERLEGLFRNLRNDLNTHYLVEETVLFPHIKT